MENETKWVDNPDTISIGKRLAVGGGIGLAVGATIGLIVFRGHLKFYRKDIIGLSLALGAVGVGFTFITHPPKKLIKLQK